MKFLCPLISMAIASILITGCGAEEKAPDSQLKVHTLDVAYIRPSSLVYQSPNFWTKADNTYSPSDMAVIGPASKKMHELLSNATTRGSILSCAKQRSTKDIPDLARFEAQLKTGFNNSDITVLWVTHLSQEPNVAGRGTLGLGGSDLTCGTVNFPECGGMFRIALNMDLMGDESAFFLKIDRGYWAGVMAHEIAHNLGLNHPTGYPGSFITEFGNCTASAAGYTGALDLTGAEAPSLEM
ncbi:MAG: hypothetical protein M3Q07_22970 [Pseudobdellovibrionaceae bacterium]|nr:hypothetical protein [Pseudobdellovibrionaceae bacterium]